MDKTIRLDEGSHDLFVATPYFKGTGTSTTDSNPFVSMDKTIRLDEGSHDLFVATPYFKGTGTSTTDSNPYARSNELILENKGITNEKSTPEVAAATLHSGAIIHSSMSSTAPVDQSPDKRSKLVFVFLSKDKQRFEVSAATASCSDYLGPMIEGRTGKGDGVITIPLTDYKGQILKLMVKWLDYYAQEQGRTSSVSSQPLSRSYPNQTWSSFFTVTSVIPSVQHPVSAWERKFFNSLTHDQMKALMDLADYLKISGLTIAASAYFTEKFTSRTVVPVPDFVNQKLDYTAPRRGNLLERMGYAATCPP